MQAEIIRKKQKKRKNDRSTHLKNLNNVYGLKKN